MSADLRGPWRETLGTLEFDVVCRLAGVCADSTPGKAYARTLVPEVHRSSVEVRLAETTEMSGLVASGAMPGLGSICEMDVYAGRLAPEGTWLSPEELVAVIAHLRLAESVRRAVTGSDRSCRSLENIARPMATYPELRRELEAAIDEKDATVRDDASEELGRIRRRLADIDRRIRRSLDAMLGRKEVQDALSEPIFTLREERLVLPVRAERRNAIPGVLRGRSSSGQTLFIEPQAIVGMGDEKRDLHEEEREEVVRVLRALGSRLRPELPLLRDGAERLVRLDVIKAKARLSTIWSGVVPSLEDRDFLWDIQEGRHPLLDPAVRPLLREAGIDTATGDDHPLVPVSVGLPTGYHALVVTGPNTGGKTATLKLVGLFHLMAQAGFLVPAAQGSVLAVYQTIRADIGDEQSLTQNLSTFSSHMARISSFFTSLELPSLVVLDELGAGTDPREGEALGLALLEALAKRGATVVASTHYGAIKSYAMATPGVLSVAMEWDEATLRPTYRLSRGATGASHAVPIAERLGMDETVLSRAREILERGQTTESRRVAELAARLEAAEEERSALVAQRTAIAQRLAEAEERASDLRRRQSELDASTRQIVADARRKVRGVVGFVEEQASKLLAEAASLSPAELRKRRKKLLEDAESQMALALPASPSAPPPAADASADASSETGKERAPLAPAPGRKARHRALGLTGTILEMTTRGKRGDTEIELDLGGKRLRVRPEEIEVLHEAIASSSYTFKPAASAEDRMVPLELSLIGFRVEEALEEADRYLDRALTSGMSKVRIVHGFGSGRLRDAMHQFLKRHPQVKNFRLGEDGEGGGGATVVTLR